MSEQQTQGGQAPRRRRRRRDPNGLRSFNRLEAAAEGAIQGATLNFGDEAGWVDPAAAEQHPLAFQAGNLVGGLLPTLGLGGMVVGRSVLQGAQGLRYAARAAAIDGGFGALQGAGGYDPGAAESLQERLQGAAGGAGVGAVTAGLLPAAFSPGGYAGQIVDNAPVLLNRASGGSLGSPYRRNPDRMLQPAGGRYTVDVFEDALARDEAAARAAHAAELATARRAAERARQAAHNQPLPDDRTPPNVRAVLEERRRKALEQADEAEAAVAALERTAATSPLNRNGGEYFPVDRMGPNAGGLFNLALENPRARAVFQEHVARQQAQGARAMLEPLQSMGQPLRGQALDPRSSLHDVTGDLLAAVDDPSVHKDWVRAARALSAHPEAREELARAVVQRIEQRLATAGPVEQVLLAQRLGPRGDLRTKLQALGAAAPARENGARGQLPTRRGMERAGAIFDEADPRVRLAMEGPGPRSPAFSNTRDTMLAREGRQAPWGARGNRDVRGDNPPAPLDEESAARLMELMTGRRTRTYQPPGPSDAPLLETAAVPGMRWRNPFVGDVIAPETAEAAFYAGKPAPSFIDQTAHGYGLVPFVFNPEYRARAEEERRRAAQSGYTGGY